LTVKRHQRAQTEKTITAGKYSKVSDKLRKKIENKKNMKQ